MAEDRTSEFLSLARTLPAADRLKPTGEAPLSATATGRYGGRHNESSYAQLKDFHTTAGGISRDIASTSALLAELTKVVRQKSLFQDDSHQVNDLVVRIKGSIENLNGRLDQAGQQIAIQKRQLGKNSQAGQEADNLVGQLKEEFVQATAGFKKVLQQRTDGMKETTDRKRQVYGGSIKDQDYASMVNLENKPPVYESSMGLSMGQGGFPTLDLTSGMSAGEPTGSGSQLPRPRKYFVCVCVLE
jgi:syntaxin 5